MKSETEIRRAARNRLADAVRVTLGANAADSIRSGGYGNAWTEAALAALESTARQPLAEPDDDE